MTPNQIREELSKAYVYAVAARCGFKVGTWSQDDDCIDLTLGAPGELGVGMRSGLKLDLQLKSTSDPRHDRDDHLALSLPRRHYNRLRHDAHVPLLLVLLMLPRDTAAWLTHTPEALALRRCAYWADLRGSRAISGDAASTTVRVPKQNVFSPEALCSMMTKLSRGQEP